MQSNDQLRRKLYERDGRKCHYCGIEEENFLRIWARDDDTRPRLGFRRGRRGKTLEIDHKDNNNRDNDDEENCVLACYACNNAKSDVFSYDEFKRVGEVIRQIYQEKRSI